VTAASDDVLTKIRDLLALADGNANEHEAAAAMAAATTLMARHNIERAEVLAHEPAPDEEVEVVTETLDNDFSSRMPRWRSLLATGIAAANGCSAFTNVGLGRVLTLEIIGTRLAVGASRYLYLYAARQIDRFTADALEAAGKPGKTWATNFRIACASRVVVRYTEAVENSRVAAQSTASSSALVHVSTADALIKAGVEDEETRLRLKTARHAPLRPDLEALEAGRAAGDMVDIGPASASLGSGTTGDLSEAVEAVAEAAVRTLTEEQLRTLTFMLVRGTMPNSQWDHFWERTFPRTKQGKLDGNAKNGRVRTMQALVRAGLLRREEWFEITDLGRARLREYARDGRWKACVRVAWANSPINDGVWALKMLLPSEMLTRAKLGALLDM